MSRVLSFPIRSNSNPFQKIFDYLIVCFFCCFFCLFVCCVAQITVDTVKNESQIKFNASREVIILELPLINCCHNGTKSEEKTTQTKTKHLIIKVTTYYVNGWNEITKIDDNKGRQQDQEGTIPIER